MATITAITAASIARAYRDFGPAHIDEVIVSGGGARNPSLLEELRRRLPGIPVRRIDETGVPGDAKEAVAFALLGHEAVHGRPGNVPACTGATRPAILGQITPGENFNEVMQRALLEENRWERTLSLRLMP
jgi:anhydro-N-acetylmuramic acid kinase